MWKKNFRHNEFGQFPVLSDLYKNCKLSFGFKQTFKNLETFPDILSMKVSQWVMIPFVNTETFQEKLVELLTKLSEWR